MDDPTEDTDGPICAGDGPVQDTWPSLRCYGCGPANPDGIQLKSYVGADGETLVATVEPDKRFTSGAPNVMYGGHVASLLDCHSIWTAITFAYRDEGRPLGSEPQIQYVTGRLSVDYRKPTPLDRPVRLTAWVEGEVGRRTTIGSEIAAEGGVTATGELVAVRVDATGDSHHDRV